MVSYLTPYILQVAYLKTPINDVSSDLFYDLLRNYVILLLYKIPKKFIKARKIIFDYIQSQDGIYKNAVLMIIRHLYANELYEKAKIELETNNAELKLKEFEKLYNQFSNEKYLNNHSAMQETSYYLHASGSIYSNPNYNLSKLEKEKYLLTVHNFLRANKDYIIGSEDEIKTYAQRVLNKQTKPNKDVLNANMFKIMWTRESNPNMEITEEEKNLYNIIENSQLYDLYEDEPYLTEFINLIIKKRSENKKKLDNGEGTKKQIIYESKEFIMELRKLNGSNMNAEQLKPYIKRYEIFIAGFTKYNLIRSRTLLEEEWKVFTQSILNRDVINKRKRKIEEDNEEEKDFKGETDDADEFEDKDKIERLHNEIIEFNNMLDNNYYSNLSKEEKKQYEETYNLLLEICKELNSKRAILYLKERWSTFKKTKKIASRKKMKSTEEIIKLHRKNVELKKKRYSKKTKTVIKKKSKKSKKSSKK